MRKAAIAISILFLAVLPVTAYSQSNQIVAAPNAWQLRVLWYVTGSPFGGGRVGSGAGALGDIYGPGTSAWAICFGDSSQWRIYKGITGDVEADRTPVQVFDSLGAAPRYPVVGDFWGTGHNAVGFHWGSEEVVDGRSRYFYELHVYRTEANRIDDTPSAVLNTRLMNPQKEVLPRDILVVDVDQNSIDDLVIPIGNAYNFVRQYGIWIFKGGSEFQLDSPTVVIETQEEGLVSSHRGDFDGDGHIDIVTWTPVPKGGQPKTLSFYFGDGTLTGYGRPENQRMISLQTGTYPAADHGITVLDCDGDGATDLFMNTVQGPYQGTYLFRSRSGKNARTRSFRIDDADKIWAEGTLPRTGAYLNDTTGRFAMTVFPGSTMRLISGGVDGPDNSYEAYYPNNVLWFMQPLPDVNNDGWDDLIGVNSDVNFNSGVAAILAGGPQIPRDPTMGVQAIAGEGHERAIAVWPNPVRDELHIAWRGDLKRMPTRFAMHDVLGREVAIGEVEPWHGSAVWRCGDIAAGAYTVSIFDDAGAVITTAHVIKQN